MLQQAIAATYATIWMANMVLTHFWLRFSDMLLFTVCIQL